MLDFTSTPGQVLKAVAAETAKLPAVDHNGHPLSEDTTPGEESTDV